VLRILDVTPRIVYPPDRGSSVRIYNLLRLLSQRHEVQQFAQAGWAGVAPSSWVTEERLAPSYHLHTYGHPLASIVTEVSERSWVRAPILSGLALSICRPSLLRRLISWADVVIVEFPWQFEYCRRVDPSACFVLATHNVEILKFRDYAHLRGVSLNHNLWLEAIQRMERSALQHADLVLTVSPSDRMDLAERYGLSPSRIREVPNGADITAYVPVDDETRTRAKRELNLPDKPTAIFVGANVPPNEEGVRRIQRLADRAPDLTFVIAGTVVGAGYRRRNLVITGPIADYRPYLQAADIGLCPIQYGGGTKIKLMEFLAAGLPIVAFAESLHGTMLVADEHVLVAEPDEGALLVALERLTTDRTFAARLGAAARRHAMEHHDWASIAASLEVALTRLVSR
jgi:glycosyltransferase involved in cell wall biosynthesis